MTFADRLHLARTLLATISADSPVPHEDLAAVGLLSFRGPDVLLIHDWVQAALRSRIAELEVLANLDERILTTVTGALQDQEVDR